MNVPLAFVSALFYLALVSVFYVVTLVGVLVYRRLFARRAPESLSQRIAFLALLLPPVAALLPTVAGVILRHMHGGAMVMQKSVPATPSTVAAHHTSACALIFERIGTMASFGTASQAASLILGIGAWFLIIIGTFYAVRLTFATYQLETGIFPLLSHPSPRLADSIGRVGMRLALSQPLRRRYFECALPPERSSVMGIFNARCVLSREFIETAPPEEVDALVAHEAGHLRAGDVYAAFIISVVNCLFFFLRPVRLLGKWWREATELAADNTAVKGAGGDALAVASAILRVRGSALSHFPLPAPLLPFADEGTLSTEKRIERLLTQAERDAPLTRPETPIQVAMSWGATGLLAVFGAGLLISSEAACVAHCTLELLRNIL